MKDMRAKDVQRVFERVATDWDTMRLAYYDERVIEKMAEISLLPLRNAATILPGRPTVR